MRLYNIILLSIIACIGAIVFFFACKYAYESEVAVLKQKAEKAFIEAFGQELKKRNIKGMFSFSFNANEALAVDIPDSVYIEDASGKHWHWLDPKKSSLNITNDANVRALHSYTFLKNPLLPDSLNAMWGKELQKLHVFFKSFLYISLMNVDGTVKTRKSCEQLWCNASNLIFTVYIGYACEIEIKGYLCHSIGGLIYKEILLYLLLYIVLGYGVYKFFIMFCGKMHLSSDKEIVEIVKEVEVEVIKEIPIEVPVIKEVQKMNVSTHSYKLGEHFIFYADQSRVISDGVEIPMRPQLCRLLELFLEQKDNKYMLVTSVIIEQLWPDGSGNTTRMHKAVGRLRCFINKIDPSLNILKKTDAYQLTFSEKSLCEQSD